MRLQKYRWIAAITVCSCVAWGQGGGRGRGAAAQQQPAAQPAAAPGAAPAAPAAGARGGRGGGGGGADDFFTYDPTAATAPPIPLSPPAETHQKISINGATLAYTTRTGYLALHN